MGGAVEVGLLIGATAVKELSEFEAAKAKKRALETLRTQEELKATEEGIQREKKVSQILATQRAEGAARGVTPTSASLAAISEGTFNEFAQDEEAANLNLKIKESAIDQAKENTNRQFMWQTFGNLFSAANRFNDLKVPSSPQAQSGSEVDAAMQSYTISGQHPGSLSIPGEGPLDLTRWNREEMNKIIGF